MKIYEVGGCVRDRLMGLEPRDIDYVVVGSTEADMQRLGYSQVGKDFPVFLHPTSGDEYALARTERKTGTGYNGFATQTLGVTLEEDLKRRDLTINAMAMGPEGVIDPYGGQKDIENKILRHVSNHFSEDPVRILRIARFSARYNFTVASETYGMMSQMVQNGEFDSLTKERVWLELEKALTEPYLANFFEVLGRVGALQKIFTFKDFSEPLTTDFDRNLVTIFSKTDYKSWKMPEEHKSLITLYKKYKNVIYKNLGADDRLEFLLQTRALQDSTLALKVLALTGGTEQLMSDVDKLKAIDYKSIIDSVDKKDIRISVQAAQKSALRVPGIKLR